MTDTRFADQDDMARLHLPRRLDLAGALRIWALTDGVFRPEPRYFHPEAEASPAAAEFADDGPLAVLPVGCFLVEAAGDRLILVDAGLGPATLTCTAVDPTDSHGTGMLYGGELPAQLAAAGVQPADITDLVITHLHADHYGWLVTRDDLLPNAHVTVGADDVAHFRRILTEPELLTGLSAAEIALCRDQLIRFEELIAAGRVDQVRGRRLNAQVVLEHAPGHTPGHHVVDVHVAGEHLLLLGDAITCPVQLEQPHWHSCGDVDLAEANATRERLWKRLSGPGVRGVGAHFPLLQPGRVSGRDGLRVWAADDVPRQRAPASE